MQNLLQVLINFVDINRRCRQSHPQAIKAYFCGETTAQCRCFVSPFVAIRQLALIDLFLLVVFSSRCSSHFLISPVLNMMDEELVEVHPSVVEGGRHVVTTAHGFDPE